MKGSIDILRDSMKYLSWSSDKFLPNISRVQDVAKSILSVINNYEKSLNESQKEMFNESDDEKLNDLIRKLNEIIKTGRITAATKTLEMNLQMLEVAKKTVETLEFAATQARYDLQDVIDQHNESIEFLCESLYRIRSYISDDWCLNINLIKLDLHSNNFANKVEKQEED